MAANIPLVLQRIQYYRAMEISSTPPPEIDLNQDFDEILTTYRQSSASLFAKRLFDLVLTVPVLLVCLPLFLLIGIIIKIDSAGPVFFTQKRVGRQGMLFTIYKFRTMISGAESMGKYFVAENDDQITRFGKIMRKFKIDELPQLINVFKGDMSLVGPRPMIPRIVAQYPTEVRNIVLSVPPGITGLASIAYIDETELLSTVNNPKILYDKHILPMKLHYYVYYVQVHNVWFDFKIILLTFVYLTRLFFQSLKKPEPQKFKARARQ